VDRVVSVIIESFVIKRKLALHCRMGHIVVEDEEVSGHDFMDAA
jgi:hypothetical protein